jgi:hypothetical protein
MIDLFYCESSPPPSWIPSRDQLIQQTKDFMCTETAIRILKLCCVVSGNIVTHKIQRRKAQLTLFHMTPDELSHSPEQGMRRFYEEFEYASLYDDRKWAQINHLIFNTDVQTIAQETEEKIQQRQKLKKYKKQTRKLVYQTDFAERFFDKRNEFMNSIQAKIMSSKGEVVQKDIRSRFHDNESLMRIFKSVFGRDGCQWESLCHCLAKGYRKSISLPFSIHSIQDLLGCIESFPKIPFWDGCYQVINLPFRRNICAGAPSTLLRLGLFTFDGFLASLPKVRSEIKEKLLLLVLVLTSKIVHDASINYYEFFSYPCEYKIFKKAESILASLIDFRLNEPYEEEHLFLSADLENWFVKQCRAKDLDFICRELDAEWNRRKQLFLR